MGRSAPGSFSNLKIVQSWGVLQRGICEEKAAGVEGYDTGSAGGVTFWFCPIAAMLGDDQKCSTPGWGGYGGVFSRNGKGSQSNKFSVNRRKIPGNLP